MQLYEDIEEGRYHADERKFLNTCGRKHRKIQGIRKAKLKFKDKYLKI
jgi:hypothetical protein